MADDAQLKRAFGAIALVAAAAYFGSVALQDYATGKASEHWLPVRARVISSSTSYKMYQRGFSPNVVYQYSVNGTPHTASRISFPSPRSSSDLAPSNRVCQNCPVNGTVTAYYDPHDPDRATLMRSVNDDGMQHWLLLTGLFSILALMFVGIALKGIKSDSRKAKVTEPLTGHDS